MSSCWQNTIGKIRRYKMGQKKEDSEEINTRNQRVIHDAMIATTMVKERSWALALICWVSSINKWRRLLDINWYIFLCQIWPIDKHWSHETRRLHCIRPWTPCWRAGSTSGWRCWAPPAPCPRAPSAPWRGRRASRTNSETWSIIITRIAFLVSSAVTCSWPLSWLCPSCC